MNLGLGTAALGRPQYINIRLKPSSAKNLKDFKTQSFQVLEHAYQKSVRYFDTAPGYGMAEELMLNWLNSQSDETIELATKWGYTYVANFNPNAKTHEVKEHSLEKLTEQWQVSKAFLPNLKVYQIHSATNETGVLQNKAVLDNLYQLKVENNLKIGITTTGYNQTEIIKKALDVSVESEQLFDTFQVTYNILDQSLSDVFSELQHQKKNIIIKEALANGRLFRNDKYNHYNILYNTLEAIAEKYKVGIDAILLRFCMQTIPESIVLSGASTIAQLDDNLKANTIELTEEEIHKLQNFKANTKAYWQERKELAWN